MRRRLGVLVSPVGALALVGCGGDGGDRLSKEQFIEQGDALCSRLSTDSRAIPQPTAESDFGRYASDAVALGRSAREELAALTPPEDGEQVHAALLDSLDTSLETAEGAATAAESGDTVSAGDLLTQAAEVGAAADTAAQEYGFEVCGSEDEQP